MITLHYDAFVLKAFMSEYRHHGRDARGTVCKRLGIDQPKISNLKRGRLGDFSIERLFQLVVDEAVDVNALILETEKRPIPDTNSGTFEALAEAHVIPRSLHARIAGSVGLRNRLVHRYETVQRNVLLREVPKYAEAYKEYLARVIQKYLS